MTETPTPVHNSLLVSPIDNTEGMGPAMKALNPQQRAFVRAYTITGGSSGKGAAKMSGYGNNEQTHANAAYRLLGDDRILLAIREEAQKHISQHILIAANVLAEIAQDPTHKDRLKAADMLLNRGGLLVATQHNVNLTVTPESNKEIVDRIQVLAERLGVDPKLLLGRHAALPGPESLRAPAAPAIDAEFTEVGSSKGLEDLL